MHVLPSKLPRGLRKAVLDKKLAKTSAPIKFEDDKPKVLAQWDTFINEEESNLPGNDYKEVVFTQAPEPVADLDDANIVISLLPWKMDGENAHAPVLDLDFKHEYWRESPEEEAVITHEVLANFASIPSPWLSLVDQLNEMLNPHGVKFAGDDILLTCDHHYLPSSTPGHAHLYLDFALPETKFFTMLDLLRKAWFIEPGYADASKHRGYSAVRVPWVKKPQKDVAAKMHYEEVLDEIDKAEDQSTELWEVIKKCGFNGTAQVGMKIGLKPIVVQYHTVAFEVPKGKVPVHEFSSEVVNSSNFEEFYEVWKKHYNPFDGSKLAKGGIIPGYGKIIPQKSKGTHLHVDGTHNDGPKIVGGWVVGGWTDEHVHWVDPVQKAPEPKITEMFYDYQKMAWVCSFNDGTKKVINAEAFEVVVGKKPHEIQAEFQAEFPKPTYKNSHASAEFGFPEKYFDSGNVYVNGPGLKGVKPEGIIYDEITDFASKWVEDQKYLKSLNLWSEKTGEEIIKDITDHKKNVYGEHNE